MGISSLCAAICVGLLVRSEVMSQNSADLNWAVTEAWNAAECFKAASGDMEKTAQFTGGELAENMLVLRYDGDFELTLAPAREDGYISVVLSVRRTETDEDI